MKEGFADILVTFNEMASSGYTEVVSDWVDDMEGSGVSLEELSNLAMDLLEDYDDDNVTYERLITDPIFKNHILDMIKETKSVLEVIVGSTREWMDPPDEDEDEDGDEDFFSSQEELDSWKKDFGGIR